MCKRKFGLSALLLMLAASTTTFGAILPINEGVLSTAGSDDFTWRYRFDLPDDARVEVGNFITIYDFQGFTGDHREPAGWTFSSTLSGPEPILIDVSDDDPTIPNLTWTFNGGLVISGPPLVLGIFEADSIFDLPDLGSFAAQATKDGGQQDGTPASNIGLAQIPIPEPGCLMGLALAATLFLRRRD